VSSDVVDGAAGRGPSGVDTEDAADGEPVVDAGDAGLDVALPPEGGAAGETACISTDANVPASFNFIMTAVP
jgi:hypothetical protein